MVCTFYIRYLCPGMNAEFGLELVATVLTKLEICYPRIYNANTLQVYLQQGTPAHYSNLAYLWEERIQLINYPLMLIKIFVDEVLSDCSTKCILICIPPNFCLENAVNQQQQQMQHQMQSGSSSSNQRDNTASPSNSHCRDDNYEVVSEKSA